MAANDAATDALIARLMAGEDNFYEAGEAEPDDDSGSDYSSKATKRKQKAKTAAKPKGKRLCARYCKVRRCKSFKRQLVLLVLRGVWRC